MPAYGATGLFCLRLRRGAGGGACPLARRGPPRRGRPSRGGRGRGGRGVATAAVACAGSGSLAFAWRPAGPCRGSCVIARTRGHGGRVWGWPCLHAFPPRGMCTPVDGEAAWRGSTRRGAAACEGGGWRGVDQAPVPQGCLSQRLPAGLRRCRGSSSSVYSHDSRHRTAPALQR